MIAPTTRRWKSSHFQKRVHWMTLWSTSQWLRNQSFILIIYQKFPKIILCYGKESIAIIFDPGGRRFFLWFMFFYLMLIRYDTTKQNFSLIPLIFAERQYIYQRFLRNLREKYLERFYLVDNRIIKFYLNAVSLPFKKLPWIFRI